jgi:hypothetical protein
MEGIKRPMKIAVFLAAGFLLGSPLIFAEEGKEIAWQDYAKATAEAKKADKPVLIDFWRPG